MDVQLSDHQDQFNITYGPIESRRFGHVLVINVLGDGGKICSFNCPYCDLGPTELKLNQIKRKITLPTVDEISKAVSHTFQKIHQRGPSVDTIVLSGNGEPTLHYDFLDVTKTLIEARNTWLPETPFKVLTNGALLDSRKIAYALNKFDERIVKVDAGNEKIFKVINSPLSRTNLAKVIAGIRGLSDVVVQSLFVQGAVDNTEFTEIEEWIEVIAMIKPKGVHIQGLSRPAAVKGLIRCDEDTLYAIASRLERRTRIKASVFP